MYSRNTDRGGRRIKLPPGYDGSAFRHETGEIRRFAEDTEMKIHSPEPASYADDAYISQENGEETVWTKKAERPAREMSEPVEEEVFEASEQRYLLPTEKTEPKPVCERGDASFLEGLLTGLGSEEWMLFLVILLLLADGSDAWDIILLLSLLMAVR